MKWVRCLYDGGFETSTIGKVYKVLSISHFTNWTSMRVNDRVCIINDLGQRDFLSLITYDDRVWFEDATDLVREEKLNDILGL